MQELIRLAPDWFGKIDKEMHIYPVGSDDLSASKLFRDFQADHFGHLRLLYCIDTHVARVHGKGF